MFVQKLIMVIKDEYFPRKKSSKPQLLLACPDGGYHGLGVQFLEIAMLDQQIDCKAIYTSVPTLEILNLAKASQVQAIGFSLTNTDLHSPFENLPEMVSDICKKTQPPLIVIGGQAASLSKLANFNVIYNDGSLECLITLLQTKSAS
jgi:methylmalonyl-CoA mutase cobalamin-binding subunit